MSLPCFLRLALTLGMLAPFTGPAAEVAGQTADGRITLVAHTPGNTASWDFKPTRWGRYDLEATVATAAAGAELQVELAGQSLSARLPATATANPTTVLLGRFYLAKSDPFTLRASPKPGSSGSFVLKTITLRPAPEGDPVIQQISGEIVLRASQATTHSVMMRYEPATNKNCLGYWVNPADWADWEFTVTQPGAFELEVWQGCGWGHGGSDVNVEIGGVKVPFVVEETGHFQNFVPRRLGRVTLTAGGKHSLAIKPQRKQGGAVMDIRQVRLVPAATGPAPAIAAMGLLAAKRVVWLGDSITYGGEWGEFVEAWVRMQFPSAEVEFLNLGLPSETVSGLSEDGHAGGAFPRPDAHERLGRLLEKAKPDLIVASYGMNDGIYFPFGDDRFKRFQDGIKRLRERAAHEGVRVIHLTPPVFDPQPLAGRTLPAGRDAYPQPFEGYNGVLDRYSEWLVSQHTNGWEVVDPHGPMNRFLVEQRRTNPQFLLAGDGVHANTQGHWLIARELLRHLGANDALANADQSDALVKSHPRGAEILQRVQQRQRVLKDAWLTHVGHRRPGMGQGKPLPEAEAEAKALAAKLQALR